ncbi:MULTISPECIES: nuclear transport factor 2 family protein [Streptomyces]|uniref:nuclear transport factor 2 family protein n=1 Tax=Streptomyces TaxID=1883 RepID=UPI001677093B|nr:MULTISPECIES: nuclear transport factor 2 family protein [Streptomyces]MBK3527819.1 tautomerase family protein [Streptomyces sp. MBT70]GGR95433.1 hypothetical protein GCM10010236_57480 [Streptomyces eurythermus]
MPIIRVSLMEGFASRAEQAQIAYGMTEALVDVMGDLVRPYVYVTVDDLRAGATAVGGTMLTEVDVRDGIATSDRLLTDRPLPQQIEAAYAALGTGDEEAIAQYWARDLTWSVPSDSPLAGTYEGLDAFLGYLGKRPRPFSGDARPALIRGSVSLQVRTETAAGDAEPDREPALDVIHELTWRDGKVIAGREARFGAGSACADSYWG